MHMKRGIGALAQYQDAFESGAHLSARDAEALFHAIREERDPESIASLLRAWLSKGYSAEEIAACAAVLRREVRRVECSHDIFVDLVGTGGSKSKTFNVSTAAALVAAGAGLPVAKHGNRAASSRSGSADALDALGIALDADARSASRSINEHGICFMFAPHFHNLTRELAEARKKIGKPTIFNLLGPVANPASAPHQLIGIWSGRKARMYGEALRALGTKRSWIVHGSDGLDEITLSGPTEVTEVTAKEVRSFTVSPSDFGLGEEQIGDLASDTPSKSAGRILDVIEGRETGSGRRLVAVNAAAALYLTGMTDSLRKARHMAEESIDSGAAKRKLDILREGPGNE